MTAQQKQRYAHVIDLFIIQPWDTVEAPPATEPQREDYDTEWDYTGALLKWKKNGS